MRLDAENSDRRLSAFLRYAALYSPFYRDQTWARNLRQGHRVNLCDIPLTTKSEVRADPARLYAIEFEKHGGYALKYTSGSTGMPTPIRKSYMHFSINADENHRLRSPWGFNEHLATITAIAPTDDHPMGTIRKQFTLDGRLIYRLYSRSIDAMLGLAKETRASHIRGQAGPITALLEESAALAHLRLVGTNEETAPGRLGELLERIPGCRRYDSYGSVETGLIGVSCPRCGGYHLAQQNAHFEVLDKHDRPVSPCKMGRLVATVFSNHAMPLVRYDLRDYVTPVPSLCEPGQIALEKVFGRERTLLKLPNGDRIQPSIDAKRVFKLGLKRFKIVQTAIDCCELRYEPFDLSFELPQRAAQDLIDTELSPLFRAIPVKVTDFPAAPSGKYFMHECLV